MSAKVIMDKSKSVLASIRAMADKHVLVGIPASENIRSGDPITNAQLGYIHENGSPANNIPARPFLKPGVEAIKRDAAAILKQAAKDGIDNPSAIEQGLNKVGLIGQASVKKRIVSGEGFAPLKAGTIAARKRRGAKGEKPLIRTGQLLNSITYVVRSR